MESRAQQHGSKNVKFVEAYDFRQPKLFSKEIMRTLEVIHENLSRNMSRIFSSALRYKIDLSLTKIDQVNASEFVQELDSPSVIYSMFAKELNGDITVVLPPDFCIHLIERQSGGRGKKLPEPRSLTVIEEKIVSRAIRALKNDIITAWEPYLDLSIEETLYDSKPENLHFSNVDPTIVARFSVVLDNQVVNMVVVYSYSILKEALNDTVMRRGSSSKMTKLSEDELESYKQTLKKADVTVQALLGTTTLTLSDILSLKEGDTIPLTQKSEQPLEVRVNGVTKMNAYPGLIQGRRAVKIFDLVGEINEQELV